MHRETVLMVCRATGVDEASAEEMAKHVGVVAQFGYAVRAMLVASLLLAAGKAANLIDLPGWACAMPFVVSLLVLPPMALVVGLLIVRKVKAGRPAGR